jgi:AmmeMemoRadiSam system protein B
MPDFSDQTPLPALKAGLEAVEIEHEGKPMIVLRDQEGIVDQPMGLSVGGFLVASLLNGRHTAEEIRTVFTKSTGTVLTSAEIQTLVSQLEKAQLLETPALHERRKKILDDFLASPTRKAQFLGNGYPQEPLELAVHLGKYFQAPKGPQKQLASQPTEKAAPWGLVAPHIDLHRGGPAYAWAYQALAECPAPDTIVALGVAHVSPNSPWVFSNKAYETPYGPLPTHPELSKELGKCLWYDPCVDEGVHRTEHSLEFQALWLKYLWREKTPSWVPILCSSFYAFANDRPPSEISTVEEAIQKMGQVLKRRSEAGEKILILMGVDLAHVGPRFGDEIELTPDVRQKIEKEDRASLDLALQLDADGFYRSIIADDHWRKVCGLSSLYTGLRLLKIMAGAHPLPAKLLTYGQADDPMGGVVSFASAIFPRS